MGRAVPGLGEPPVSVGRAMGHWVMGMAAIQTPALVLCDCPTGEGRMGQRPPRWELLSQSQRRGSQSRVSLFPSLRPASLGTLSHALSPRGPWMRIGAGSCPGSGRTHCDLPSFCRENRSRPHSSSG